MAPVLEKHASQTRLFAKIVRQTWFRAIAKLIERITIPGILLHYAVRRNASATWHAQHSLTGLPMVRYESIQCISPEYAQKIRDQIDGDESSLIITEIYVPRADLPHFLAQAVDLLRSNRTTVIYGTVRLIEKDDRAFLHGPKNPTPV